MRINLETVKQLLDSVTVSTYQIREATGISHNAIGAYRRGEREFENLNLTTVEKLYQYALQLKKERIPMITKDQIQEFAEFILESMPHYDMEAFMWNDGEYGSRHKSNFSPHEDEIVAVVPLEWDGIGGGLSRSDYERFAMYNKDDYPNDTNMELKFFTDYYIPNLLDNQGW